MAQVMVRQEAALTAGDDSPEWSFGEYAVLAGWAFFVLSLLKGLWGILWWCQTPRKPGSEDRAEKTGAQTCSQLCGRTREEEEPRRSHSPMRGGSGKRQISVTPERRRVTNSLMESPGKSPEIQGARTQILEAMVQRAQPVVQDLHDMHRLGGVGPGPMLRRGSRTQ